MLCHSVLLCILVLNINHNLLPVWCFMTYKALSHTCLIWSSQPHYEMSRTEIIPLILEIKKLRIREIRQCAIAQLTSRNPGLQPRSSNLSSVLHLYFFFAGEVIISSNICLLQSLSLLCLGLQGNKYEMSWCSSRDPWSSVQFFEIIFFSVLQTE